MLFYVSAAKRTLSILVVHTAKASAEERAARRARHREDIGSQDLAMAASKEPEQEPEMIFQPDFECDTCGRRAPECACPPATSRADLTCPTCRQVGDVDLRDVVYGNACVVCFDTKPCVIFASCRHANVCIDCAMRL